MVGGISGDWREPNSDNDNQRRQLNFVEPVPPKAANLHYTYQNIVGGSPIGTLS